MKRKKVMPTSNRKGAASTAKKRTVSPRPKRGPAKIQDNWFKRNKVAIIIFILLFGAIGIYLIVQSHAYGNELQSALDGGVQCADQNGGIYACNGSSGENWGGTDSLGRLHIGPSASNLCLAQVGANASRGVGNSALGMSVAGVPCGSSAPWGGSWYWDGQHRLHNKHAESAVGTTQYCLDVTGAALNGGLETWSCNGGDNQKWFVEPAGTTGSGSGGGSGGGTTSRCGSGSYGAIVGSGAISARIDQGKDFVPSSSAGYAICAPASGYITRADYGHNYVGTPGTALVIEKLDTAPNVSSSSRYIFYAELISINSRLTGATTSQPIRVNKGDIIGHNYTNPGIEVGWGSSATQGFLCAYAGSGATSCGYSFDSWVRGQ